MYIIYHLFIRKLYPGSVTRPLNAGRISARNQKGEDTPTLNDRVFLGGRGVVQWFRLQKQY